MRTKKKEEGRMKEGEVERKKIMNAHARRPEDPCRMKGRETTAA